ncbi:Cytochrome P450 71C4 [Hordeum vulgare]|uniref:indole-2-monooxygenase-like isoform X2 n=1 Tax=Hordeum vulgare subsp. vulgare TaxID=112509 RepID=UPI00029503F4|nr:indole-2-monooxygenase-like isoform X2 [Hordeum vulgare subsp. vulgare]KAE8783866.1 Cytochrome P450 71C4 [Hordeum vulgare]
MAELMQKLMLGTLPRACLFLFLFFLVFVGYWFTGKFSAKRRQRLPPSPPALPIIGHLHLIGSLPHVSLRNLAKKHGPDVMLLRLGAVPNLVVSSSHAAEAVLRTHDHVFASRPHSVVSDTIMYGSCDIGFAPYGEYWRQAKKLVTTHMLSVKKVQSFRSAAAEEISIVVAKINEAAAADGEVDMSELLHTFANDMACRIVSGKFFLRDGRSKLFRELIKDTSRLLGGFSLEEYFPALGRVGVLKKAVCAKAKRVRNRWADLLDQVIDDHVSKRKLASDHKDDDFVDIMLSVQQEYALTREHMKALLTDVFFGAIDTSANVLEFTLAELMRRPHMMEKLQDEVRGIVPQGQEIISETDMNNMTYLRAVIKESLRLRPVAPLLAPHLAMADCIIDGYIVPAGTRVVVNAWAIGRDPSSWEYPEEFIPERFTDEGSTMHINFKGNDFQFLPFGAGRRMCPGMNLGIANVELMLANLVCHFDWELPLGVGRKDIDMTEVFGLTVRRKEKLLLVPKSRM